MATGPNDLSADEALMARLLAGDLSAFDALYARYEQPLFAFLLTYVREPAEAEDLFHEAFLALLAEARRTKHVTHVRGWLFKVARHACLKRLRRPTDWADVPLDEPSPHELADEQLGHAQRRQHLTRQVERLPDALRELYALRCQGLSYEELALVLGVPLGTVKSRLHELVRRLRVEVSS